ncbi:bifunctional metallophosphatase/5'-nucleotidase [Numidum massiliense]|uniref:bifunctional metallophosphatase/5'-nucleotidase n=1 Tax=Numidum massiliense TaxID=1522315 RepID=UPI0006D5A3F0|nr:5'-nucleotidase C-terminal domain-containing protein [Numidum massiliense]
MKKFVSLLLVCVLLFAVGCAADSGQASDDKEPANTEQNADSGKEAKDKKADEKAKDEKSDGEWQLTVLHTNDTHGHLENVPRRFTAVKEIRKEVENAILVDAGDVFSGTLYFTKFFGLADRDFMEKLGYDAMVPGNHEFDKGPKKFAEFVDQAGFPLVSANIDYSAEPTLKDLFVDEIAAQKDGYGGKIYPAVVLDVNGEKVGVLGLTTEETVTLASPGKKLKFNSVVEAAQQAVAKLEEQGVHKIIALTHLGHTEDLALADAVDGIDVIVGGHSHTKVDEPVVVEKDNGPTVVVQADEWGNFLGRLDVTFDKDGKLTKWNGKLIDINEQDKDEKFVIADDEEAQAALDEYTKELEKMTKQVVGRTKVDLDGERDHVRTQETNLANLIADSILWKAKDHGATLAIHNGGNVRASISKGDITLGDIRTVQPFENMLVTVELTGQQVMDALEHGVSEVEEGHGGFPQVSGMRYEFDSSQPAGERLLKVEVKKGKTYAPIDPKATYDVVTNSFLADGGDGYDMLKKAKDDGKLKELYFVDYEVFMEYLKEVGEVNPQVEGRIIDVSAVEKAS